jgi:hypothetical protein
MKLVFIYGSPASGKLTIAKELTTLTGYRLFHNHVIVDAVASVFPFGSDRFTRLREEFWLTMFREAGEAGQSIIFTFCPEATVAPDFPDRVRHAIESVGGELLLVRLTLPTEEQERRIGNADRAEFGKLLSLDLLRQIRGELSECEAAMPPAALTIDTALVEPYAAAKMIANTLGLPFNSASGQVGG